MGSKTIVVTSSSEDNPSDFTAFLSNDLDLKGRWLCKLDSISLEIRQPAKTYRRHNLTPFFVCVDFIEESEVNGSLIPMLGMFSITEWKSNPPSKVYKKYNISFNDRYYPVTRSYINRIRIKILDRNLNAPKIADENLFTDIACVKITLTQNV